jgi:TPR repeat protein
MYYDGTGVTQDHAVAARWLQMAVDFGDRSGIAEVMLGNIEAAVRARSRAERGDASSMRSLAFGYAFGWGLPRSAELSYVWLRLAILNGCEQSGSLLASAKARLTAEQVEEADRAVMQWRPKIRH